MGFNTPEVATQLRDVIRLLVKDEIDKQRPQVRYAMAWGVDWSTGTCFVSFPGETTIVPVKMNDVCPTTVGQYVRVEGTVGDKYITAVVGQNNQTWHSFEASLGAGWDTGGGSITVQYRLDGETCTVYWHVVFGAGTIATGAAGSKFQLEMPFKVKPGNYAFNAAHLKTSSAAFEATSYMPTSSIPQFLEMFCSSEPGGVTGTSPVLIANLTSLGGTCTYYVDRLSIPAARDQLPGTFI